jgi:aldehyde dehydrogenase (NAD+)
LARFITREIGMTPPEALDEVQAAIEACAQVGAEGANHQEAPPQGPGIHRPLGVYGVMATGHSPLAAPIRTILPALLAGNTVAWKPSDNTPTSAYLMLRALMEAGLPPGVLNTVNGRGRAGCGKHFVAGIDKGHFQAFSFVGSRPLGRTVGEHCGRALIPHHLHLVGRGTMVVLPDADLARAAEDALRSAFAFGGQSPLGLQHILLHEACVADFKQAFLERVAGLVVGNPLMDPAVAYGPMIHARAATAFKEHWERGLQEGATLLLGGEAWTEANRDGRVKGEVGHGHYMQPCVWDDVRPGMGLFRNPVLGPTVNLCTFPDLDEAMAWLQASPGAPAHSLYTQDIATIGRFRAEVRAEILTINTTADAPETHLPFPSLGTSADGHLRWQALGGSPLGAQGPRPPFPTAPALKTDWEGL